LTAVQVGHSLARLIFETSPYKKAVFLYVVWQHTRKSRVS
jgi:hypothetical protein